MKVRVLHVWAVVAAVVACGTTGGSGTRAAATAPVTPTPAVTNSFSVPITSIQNFPEGVNEPPSQVHGTAEVSVRGDCCFDIMLMVVNLKPDSMHEANLHYGKDCDDYEPPLAVGPHFTLVADGNGNASDTVHFPFPYSRPSQTGTLGWFIDVHITHHGAGILACGNLPQA